MNKAKSIKLKKLKMTQVWKDDVVVPVTVLKLESGDSDAFNQLTEGSLVTLIAVSKGKGFQGVVKRYGFAGGPKSHGQKHSHRAPGSIGATEPARTMPGKKMPGHMGVQRITTKKVPIVHCDPEKGIVMVKGAVPGMRGSVVEIKSEKT